MSQNQSNVERFAGPNMIQDSHHMSEIPVAQDQKSKGARQADQGQAGNQQAGGKRQFEYKNPRQVD